MKIFLAGVSNATCKRNTHRHVKLMAERGLKYHELLSYLTAKQASVWEQAMALSEVREEFFLDCGAYSAWTQGEEISLDEYASFVLDRADTFKAIANRDVIPGSWGRVPTQLEIDASAEEGWKNFYRLQDRFKAWEDGQGRRVPFEFIHTFHQGEDVGWLERLLHEGGDYIAISPGNDHTTAQKMKWLDDIMPLLTDDRGWPTVRFHGFGVTSLEIMERYPFWSVDSTTWVLAGRYGTVHIPANGEVHRIVFSDQSPKVREEGEHFMSLCKRDQEIIRAYLDQIGFTPEQLAGDYVVREQANIIYFVALEKNWAPQPWERPRACSRFKF